MPVLFKRHIVKGESEILLSYEGKLTFDLINEFIEETEAKLKSKSISLKSERRILNSLVEIFQNMVNNIDFDDNLFAYNSECLTATLKVWVKDNKCYVATGNFIVNENIEKLSSWLTKLNGLDKKQLRDLWNEIVINGLFNDYGGAGLGFIEIRRKANRKLEFSFEKVDSKFSYFNFELFIPLDLN